LFGKVTVSIVSHGHGEMIPCLLDQLARYPTHVARVIVTHNIPGDASYSTKDLLFEVVTIDNEKPLGFGANHNQAFRHCETDYFCVMNPDIHFIEEPFDTLLKLDVNPAVAILAPKVITPQGDNDGNARSFPTPWDLVKKLFGCYDGIFLGNEEKEIDYPDWLAGMFLLVKSDKYSELKGFDESFRLYYEDVDLSARAWKKGFGVSLCKNAVVMHDARKSSHSEFRYFIKHIKSALLFFFKYYGRYPARKAFLENVRNAKVS